MVRINLIDPKTLADQHLIAEYDEILMLLGHVKRYPKIKFMPKEYCLGKGHINFFKDKLVYLKRRHEFLKKEMIRRGFNPSINIDLKPFDQSLCNDWKPNKDDMKVIKERIIKKLRLNPEYYSYYRQKKDQRFLIDLIENAGFR